MSKIKYAYLQGQSWLYRRHYPKDVALLLGVPAFKQTLKTGDVKTARTRATEVNRKFEETVERIRAGTDRVLAEGGTLEAVSAVEWEEDRQVSTVRLRAALVAERVDLEALSFATAQQQAITKVGPLATRYLNRRSNELRHGGFKSVRYSVGLFASKFRDRAVRSLGREDGQLFLSLVSQLATVIGKSEASRGLTLDRLVRFSAGRKTIGSRTQKRIWSQVNHFLDWCVYEGELEQNPFRSVRFEQKVKGSPYAVLSNEEVLALLAREDPLLHDPLLFCLLTGMRAGEAAGLLRDDLVSRGNLGTFVHVRPNSLRLLKTDAAERLVPLHSTLEELVSRLPSEGPLFPEVNVNRITKRFADLRRLLRIDRPGVVFHSTRKWFITQCERTGVPEHFTASLVGHKSARSENGITYGIYSAGISDEQKRGIIDQIRLP